MILNIIYVCKTTFFVILSCPLWVLKFSLSWGYCKCQTTLQRIKRNLSTGLLGGWFFKFRPFTTLVAWFKSSQRRLTKGSKRSRSINVEESKPLNAVDVPDVSVVEDANYRHERNPSFKYRQRVRYVDHDMSYRGGVVEWIGRHTGNGCEVVVISTDDFYGSRDLVGKVFLPVEFSLRSCPNGYRMLAAREVEKIDDVKIGDFCFIRKNKTSKSRNGGFLRGRRNESFLIHRIDKIFRDIRDSDDLSAEDYHLVKVPPPETEPVSSEHIEPIAGSQTKLFSGRNKGIQGKGNSCYLDSLIFSFFAYSNALDYILNAGDDGRSAAYLEVLNTLRYEIVYPLRLHQFVSYHNVERLRRSIARQVKNDSYLNETRDISECLDVLFDRLLSVPPLVYVGHFVQDRVQFNGVHVVEVFNVSDAIYPTTEQLLRSSAVSMQFCLKTMTDCLFLQIAREDGSKVNVFPSIDIDLKDLCYDTAKACTICQCQATKQFWNASLDIGGTYFCDDCARENELNLEEGLKLPEVDMTREDAEETLLTLAGVLCIERSHFNCFVRCGRMEQWVFFDSMRDQEEIFNPDDGRQHAVNIPCVKEMPNFREWLESAHSELKSNSNLARFRGSMDAEDFDIASRIFTYPSFFIYQRI